MEYVFGASGRAMLLRRSMLEDIGLLASLDDDFPAPAQILIMVTPITEIRLTLRYKRGANRWDSTARCASSSDPTGKRIARYPNVKPDPYFSNSALLNFLINST
jgi:hypothetical protein